MPVDLDDGIKDMNEFCNDHSEKMNPEYARGLLQELITQLEETWGLNTTPLLQDIFEARGQ